MFKLLNDCYATNVSMCIKKDTAVAFTDQFIVFFIEMVNWCIKLFTKQTAKKNDKFISKQS